MTYMLLRGNAGIFFSFSLVLIAVPLSESIGLFVALDVEYVSKYYKDCAYIVHIQLPYILSSVCPPLGLTLDFAQMWFP